MKTTNKYADMTVVVFVAYYIAVSLIFYSLLILK